MKRKDFDQLNRAFCEGGDLRAICLTLFGAIGEHIEEDARAPAKAPDSKAALQALVRAQERHHDEIAKAVLVNGVRYEPPPPAQDTPEVIEGAARAMWEAVPGRGRWDALRDDVRHDWYASVRAARAYAPLPGGPVTEDDVDEAVARLWNNNQDIKHIDVRDALEAFVARRMGGGK